MNIEIWPALGWRASLTEQTEKVAAAAMSSRRRRRGGDEYRR
jgi:hypothetical protein